MEHGFWSQRWSEGRIGFHQPEGSTYLAQLLGEVPAGKTLVPLAGKSLDILHLHQAGHDVVAVEFVEPAVRAFVAEQDVAVEEHKGPLGLEFRGERLRLMAADIFLVTPEITGQFDRIYDRAALVALPPDVRGRYVEHLRGLLTDEGEVWAVTFDYEQSKMQGPPFSVPESLLETFYEGARLERLVEREIIEESPNFVAKGLSSVVERVHRIHGAARR